MACETRVLPIYLVSPQLFVTSEHIISDNSSTGSPFSFNVSAGEATESRELGNLSVWGVWRGESKVRGRLPDFEDRSGVLVGVSPLLWLKVLYVNLFSNVLGSGPSIIVLSARTFSFIFSRSMSSPSPFSIPESFSRDSIRPRRFSNPSIYFALQLGQRRRPLSEVDRIPFGRIALLLNLSEDTFCFVVETVRTCWHLPITLYFLLSAHITRLPQGSMPPAKD